MLFAMAQQPSQAQGGGSAFISLIPIILIFLIFYVLLILPQRRKQKEHQKLLGSLKRGDKVVTTGGIHGQITKVSDITVTIKASEKCEITVDKSAVSKTKT
jgi:preprotein translocase subunit YajC